MFKDEHWYDVWNQIRQRDLRAFSRLLPQSLFVEAALRADVRLVRSALAIPNLVWLRILSAETTFHELKAIQGLQRSRTPKSIRYEVAGHVVLYYWCGG